MSNAFDDKYTKCINNYFNKPNFNLMEEIENIVVYKLNKLLCEDWDDDFDSLDDISWGVLSEPEEKEKKEKNKSSKVKSSRDSSIKIKDNSLNKKDEFDLEDDEENDNEESEEEENKDKKDNVKQKTNKKTKEKKDTENKEDIKKEEENLENKIKFDNGYILSYVYITKNKKQFRFKLEYLLKQYSKEFYIDMTNWLLDDCKYRDYWWYSKFDNSSDYPFIVKFKEPFLDSLINQINKMEKIEIKLTTTNTTYKDIRLLPNKQRLVFLSMFTKDNHIDLTDNLYLYEDLSKERNLYISRGAVSFVASIHDLKNNYYDRKLTKIGVQEINSFFKNYYKEEDSVNNIEEPSTHQSKNDNENIDDIFKYNREIEKLSNDVIIRVSYDKPKDSESYDSNGNIIDNNTKMLIDVGFFRKNIDKSTKSVQMHSDDISKFLKEIDVQFKVVDNIETGEDSFIIDKKDFKKVCLKLSTIYVKNEYKDFIWNDSNIDSIVFDTNNDSNPIQFLNGQVVQIHRINDNEYNAVRIGAKTLDKTIVNDEYKNKVLNKEELIKFLNSVSQYKEINKDSIRYENYPNFDFEDLLLKRDGANNVSLELKTCNIFININKELNAFNILLKDFHNGFILKKDINSFTDNEIPDSAEFLSSNTSGNIPEEIMKKIEIKAKAMNIPVDILIKKAGFSLEAKNNKIYTFIVNKNHNIHLAFSSDIKTKEAYIDRSLFKETIEKINNNFEEITNFSLGERPTDTINSTNKMEEYEDLQQKIYMVLLKSQQDNFKISEDLYDKLRNKSLNRITICYDVLIPKEKNNNQEKKYNIIYINEENKNLVSLRASKFFNKEGINEKTNRKENNIREKCFIDARNGQFWSDKKEYYGNKEEQLSKINKDLENSENKKRLPQGSIPRLNGTIYDYDSAYAPDESLFSRKRKEYNNDERLYNR